MKKILVSTLILSMLNGCGTDSSETGLTDGGTDPISPTNPNCSNDNLYEVSLLGTGGGKWHTFLVNDCNDLSMAYLQPGIIVPTEYWYEKPEGTYHRSQSSDGQLEVTKNQESWKYKWFEQHQEFELTINNSSASQWITVDHEDYEYIYNMYFNGSKMYEEAIENATLTEVIQ